MKLKSLAELIFQLDLMRALSVLFRNYALIVVAIYFAFSAYQIEYPGIFYDEILWGNAALGGIDDSMIILKIFDVPIMLMSYIGALKAWFYYPIFKLFGVTHYSIRIPMIFCGCISLLLTRWVTARLFNSSIAAIVLVILAIDSSFITQTRVDQGPVALALLISLGCIYCFIKLLDGLRLTLLLSVFCLLFAGVFNKLNFIWFVNSFLVSALLVYGKELKSSIKRSYSRRIVLVYLTIFLSYLVCVGYFIALSRTFGLMGSLKLSELPDRISFVFNELFIPQIQGDSFYNYALGALRLSASDYYSCYILAVVALGLAVSFFKHRDSESMNKSFLFISSIIMLLFAQIILTDKAVSYWHIYPLFPFSAILSAYAIYSLSERLSVSICSLRIAILLLLTPVIGYQLYMNSIYIGFYGKAEQNIHWSSASSDLLEYAMVLPYKFVSADWGIHNQLITFSGSADKFIEACYWLERFNSFGDKYEHAAGLLNNRLFQKLQNTNKRPLKTYLLLTAEGFESRRNWFVSQALNPHEMYAFILHPPGSTAFENARINLFQQASLQGIILRLEKTITDSNGKPIFEIYRPTDGFCKT